MLHTNWNLHGRCRAVSERSIVRCASRSALSDTALSFRTGMPRASRSLVNFVQTLARLIASAPQQLGLLLEIAREVALVPRANFAIVEHVRAVSDRRNFSSFRGALLVRGTRHPFRHVIAVLDLRLRIVVRATWDRRRSAVRTSVSGSRSVKQFRSLSSYVR